MLDLACGSGHRSLAWAERGFRVTGLDFDHALLRAGGERVRRLGRAAPGPLGMRGRHPAPVPGPAFDVVFNNSLLEHVPAWRLAPAETARVPRPGGVHHESLVPAAGGAFDRIDLLARLGPRGWRGLVARTLALGGPLKWPYSLVAVSMALYGVRRRAGPVPS